MADLKYCNQALFDLDLNETLSLVVAHHPWTARDSLGQIEHWLVEWNRNEFEQRLLQETGAHLFLHGHVHKAQAESFSNLRGQHLVVLGAGATYQDPEYPLRFAFYRIDCNNQEIEPQTFRYNQHRGKWEVDRALSNSFRAILPKVGPRYPSSRPCDDFDRPCDDFNDLGFDILRTLHEINKTLDDLTQKAYDLMNLPNRHSAFEDAYGKYLKKYINDIQNKEVLFSTRKETMHKNIDNLGRLAQGSLVDARMVANLHLSNLWSQFQQFSTSHEFIINHMEGYSVSQHDSYYTDLYAKIKMAKGVCDAAIGDGISFNRSFTSFRLWVLMDH